MPEHGLEGIGHLVAQPFTGHGKDIPVGLAGGRFQVFAGTAADVEDVALVIGEHGRRGVMLQDQLIRHGLETGRQLRRRTCLGVRGRTGAERRWKLDRDAHRGAIPDLDHVHARHPLQQFRHDALVRRIQVLNNHKGHAAVCRYASKEQFQRLKAPGRSADADDRERDPRGGGRRTLSRRSVRRLLSGFHRSLHFHNPMTRRRLFRLPRYSCTIPADWQSKAGLHPIPRTGPMV
ncbi:MAG: hypothetical protein A2498_10805 [Lentisphaerae bacterium RIFOXYC12_FULL_60_16]|nr:MAG: hypothetical protein A2498_10805 [Lentisphaerae bacterium RIFOXYC12_FULL_60_16]